MQISGVGLTLTWPRRLCLLRVLLGTTATVTSFPHSKHTGEGGATHAFSDWHVYLQFPCVWPFPPFLWCFPPTAILQAFQLQGCWVGATTPTLSGQLIYSSVRDCSCPLLQHSGCPALFATCLFCCCCLCSLVFFLFIPWVDVSLSRGLC
jgi:hypothetical protein